ncbi:MAG TPA: carboxypeptidase regulatory-like domain-containing protein [Mycobacteriales bacterium]
MAVIAAFDNPNAEADLAIYRTQYGLPPCTTANGCFHKVDQRGGTVYPAAEPNWAGEISLDTDMVSAVCPLCNILLVEADHNSPADLYASVNQAVAMGAKYVSNSYGIGESSEEETTYDEQVFNHPGVVITAASGDNGYATTYPAASKYVTAVGGTSLVPATNTRGWDETAWERSGSGCSRFDTKPAFQTDSDCPRRTIADVSAVSDPNTGVASYDSYGADGWMVYGGTSVAAPIVASIYALAGRVGASEQANSYPYAWPDALNDVTSGSTAFCGSYLCTAGPGYDGPTGLGTPNGALAFGQIAPHGNISGTVTDAADGHPLAGARVEAGGSSANTDAQGHYDLMLLAGSYDMTVSAYGYGHDATTGVTVTDGGNTTHDFTLTVQPMVTLSGTVTDGSGHHWPLYAKVEAPGTPLSAVYTDPFTGNYQLTVPANSTYTLQVVARYPDYRTINVQAQVGAGNATVDAAVPVNSVACTAAGYAYAYDGLATEPFDGATAPTGWTVTDSTGGGPWAFNNPNGHDNLTGGTGNFAIVDSDFYGSAAVQDTSLVTPPVDLAGVSTPSIGFNSDYEPFLDSVGDVDLSLDGGTTWTTVWHHTQDALVGPRFEVIPIPQAAGQSNVRVRFHYTDAWGFWWQIDNVHVGLRRCAPLPGGLVAGQVVDANTGNTMTGAVVTSGDQPTTTATSTATPDDPNLGDAFYWMFSSLTGPHPFTASLSPSAYLDGTASVNVVADAVTRADLGLRAGHVVVTSGAVSAAQTLDTTTTHPVTFSNDGTAPVNVTLSETGGGSGVLADQGAPLHQITGTFTPYRVGTVPGGGAVPPDASTTAAPWTALTDYPTPVMDNAVATADDGRVYSFGGVNGTVGPASSAVYNPSTQTWSAITEMSTRRDGAGVGYLGGRFYVVGGWDVTTGVPVASTEIYDPATGTWSTGASNPKPHAASAVSMVGGKLYVVGGCDAASCGSTDVMVYNPTTNTWSQAAAYPQPTSWEACGAIAGKVYCAGGISGTVDTRKGYAYNPATNSWSAIPDLPVDLWAMGSAGVNGMLVTSGGVTNGTTTATNQNYAFDPKAGAWTTAPNSNNAVYRAGSACGFTSVGGSAGGFNAIAQSELLPGLDRCDGTTDVTWLSVDSTAFTIQPGASVTVNATLDAGVATVTQPVDYTGKLAVATNSPYQVTPVDVTMSVGAPGTWSLVIGNVLGIDCSGNFVSLPGATIDAVLNSSTFTMRTDVAASYGLWLADPNGTLTVTASKDGWQTGSVSTEVQPGELIITIFLTTQNSCP